VGRSDDLIAHHLDLVFVEGLFVLFLNLGVLLVEEVTKNPGNLFHIRVNLKVLHRHSVVLRNDQVPCNHFQALDRVGVWLAVDDAHVLGYLAGSVLHKRVYFFELVSMLGYVLDFSKLLISIQVEALTWGNEVLIDDAVRQVLHCQVEDERRSKVVGVIHILSSVGPRESFHSKQLVLSHVLIFLKMTELAVVVFKLQRVAHSQAVGFSLNNVIRA
jgi:hypothetical protein